MNDMRVLLVEDDDVIREATQLALERNGFTVDVAADGLAGLASSARGARTSRCSTSCCPA